MNCYLRLMLSEWTDADIAEYHIAVALGLFDVGTKVTFAGKYKWLFETRNRCSDMISSMLKGLTDMGVLEHDEEGMTYRWNPEYKIDVNSASWK